MMETDEDGNKRQFFPITHISAVLGLREFMEGNFFQANFDQVMAQLQAHYNRVSQEIDKKASEIEQHANQKIEEFDTKISDSDEKMTNLETEIKDIQDLVEKNDIPTRDEVSANVINQISGAESAFAKKEFLVNGVEGTGARENNDSFTPFSPEDYASLVSDTGVVRVETLIDGRGAESEFQFPLINIIGERYPDFFEGLSTIAEKITRCKDKIRKVIVPSEFRGGGARYTGTGSVSNYSRLYIKNISNDNGGFWGTTATNSTASYRAFNTVIDATSMKQIQPDGSYVFKIVTKNNKSSENGIVSDGTTAAWIEIKDLRLIVEIEMNGRTLILSMMAAYSGENSVSLSEPQNVEGLKNFSDGVQSYGIDVATQDMTKVTLFQSTEISNVKGTASGIVWPIDETAIVFGGVGAHARRGGTSEPGTIYFNEAGQYLIELLWFVNSGTATRKYVYMDWIKHGTTDLLFRSGIGKINGFSYTSSVSGGGIITMGKDEGVDILLKTNVEDLIAGVKIYYIKITKIG